MGLRPPCNLLRRSAWAAPRPPIAGMHRCVAPKREAAVAHRAQPEQRLAVLPGRLAQGRIVGRHGKHSGELKVSPAALRTMSGGRVSSVVGARPGPPALQSIAMTYRSKMSAAAN